MPFKLTSRDLILLVCAYVLTAVYVMIAGQGFPLDDSWIHQTYGRNLAELGQWAFIPDQPSAASTSFIYTVLLSIGYVFRIDYVLWTHGLGATALGLTAIFSARIVAHITQIPRTGWLGGFAILTTWHLIWASAAGMETIIFACFTVMIAWWLLQLPDLETKTRLHGAIMGTLIALITLTRPEGILLGGFVGLAVLLTLYKNPRQLMMWIMSSGLFFVILLAPYLVVNLQLTGGILPNTANAKFIQHEILLSLPLTTRIADLSIAIFAGGQLFLLFTIPFFIVVAIRQQKILHLVLPLWAMSHIILYAVRLPASYQHGRYVLPTLPIWVVIGCIGLVIFWQFGHQRQRTLLPLLIRRVLARALGASFITAMLFFTFVQGHEILRVDVAIINEEMVASAHWIRDNIPQDEILAIHDIGAVGYFASRDMIDVAGLVSPEIIPLINDPEAMWSYLEFENAQYLMAFPDQIPGRNPDDSRLCPLFNTEGQTSQSVGGPNMQIYRLTWTGQCD